MNHEEIKYRFVSDPLIDPDGEEHPVTWPPQIILHAHHDSTGVVGIRLHVLVRYEEGSDRNGFSHAITSHQ